MNMPIAEINRRQINTQAFAAQPVISINSAPVASMPQKIDASVLAHYLNPTDMLDQHFALQNGSHKDVKQYVIYFRHIMAFFVDGSHCGLEQPKQFVAFLGETDTPESIVLKEKNVHIEIVLNTCSSAYRVNTNEASIQVEFPTQLTFTSKTGEDYFVE